MLREELKDAGQILTTVLTQPLSITGLPEETTLLSAAQSYKPNEGEISALSKVLSSFLDNPEPTKILLTELELLYEDINI